MIVRLAVWFLATFAAAATAIPEDAPGVILFIGDGLGTTQMALGIDYARMVEGRSLALERLMRDGNTGYALPVPYQSPVTDSAASASQMATGQKARNETLGLNPDGYPAETLVEWAHARGLLTGLVSNMRLSHATPAAFAAHQVSRYNAEAEIMDDVLDGYETDVLLGGGARALVPAGRKVSAFLAGIAPELDGGSNRKDGRNRLDEAREHGYEVVSDREGLLIAARKAEKLLGVFAASHLPYVLDKEAMGLESVPSLRDMTSAALAVVGKSDAGFFLMVEGGRIDYGGHDNDAGAMLHEILDFDEAVAAGLEFQRSHPRTLVIVTADHGTGGFSFTYGDFDPWPEARELPSGLVYRPHHVYPSREHLLKIARQKASYEYILTKSGLSPEGLVASVGEYAGLDLTLDEAKHALVRDAEGHAFIEDFRHFYGDQESNPACLLARALSRQTFVVWSSGGHTMEPVLTFGRGPGAERLRGVYDNTHLHDIIQKVLE